MRSERGDGDVKLLGRGGQWYVFAGGEVGSIGVVTKPGDGWVAEHGNRYRGYLTVEGSPFVKRADAVAAIVAYHEAEPKAKRS